jgi:dihydroorotate dehydrogenase
MSEIYQKLIRPILFQLAPEQAHDLTLTALRMVGRSRLLMEFIRRMYTAHSHDITPVSAFGLKFPNPVGLAAGYDKDGIALRGLSTLGFGHLEIGTVTPRPQEGNPRPRIFRIPDENALINRMGFPGQGADFVCQQLTEVKNRKFPVITGVNIGKNKDTPNRDAAQDYLELFFKFSPLADYLTVNVSSPNTIGLRRLQARELLEDLLGQLNHARSKIRVYRPILVKISPDLSWDELDDVLEAITRTEMDGIVATNTTISRESVNSPMRNQTGGLSGKPLRLRSREMVSEIFRRTGGLMTIIGVGGIMNTDDAKAMLDAGASLVQIYTGLVFAGPGLVKDILNQLVG